MEVILTKDVETLGGKNEVVRVKDGFARNFLFPRKLAIVANPGNLKDLGRKIKAASELKARRLEGARAVAEKLNKLHIKIVKKAGKEGKLFGSVTAMELAEQVLAAGGPELDRRKIAVPASIKTIGLYPIPVRLDVGVTASLHVEIVSDEPAKVETPVAAAAAPEAEAAAPAGDQEAPRARRPRAPRAAPTAEAEAAAPAAAARTSEAEDADEEERRKGPTKKKKRGTSEAEAVLPE